MGDLLGGDSSQTTSASQVTTLPSWLKSPIQKLITQTQELSNKPYEAYSGQRVADLTDDELAAFEAIRDQQGLASNSINQASGITQEVANRGLNGFSQDQLDQYMNPYLNNVVEATKSGMSDDFATQLANYRSKAGQSGSFGGSRFGLGESNLINEFNSGMSDYETNQRYAAYNDAQTRALQGTQMAGQASQQLANQAVQSQTAGYTDASNLSAAGAQQRANEQANLDVNYSDWQTEQAYPYQQIQFANSVYSPYAQTLKGSNTTQTTETEGGGSFLGTALGLASMAMGIPGVGTALGAGLGSMGLGGMASTIGGNIGAGSFGLTTGGQNFFNGGYSNAMNAAKGYYGPGFADGGIVKGYQDGGPLYLSDDDRSVLIAKAVKDFIKYRKEADDARPIDPSGTTTRGDLRNAWASDSFGDEPDVLDNEKATKEQPYSEELFEQLYQKLKGMSDEDLSEILSPSSALIEELNGYACGGRVKRFEDGGAAWLDSIVEDARLALKSTKNKRDRIMNDSESSALEKLGRIAVNYPEFLLAGTVEGTGNAVSKVVDSEFVQNLSKPSGQVRKEQLAKRAIKDSANSWRDQNTLGAAAGIFPKVSTTNDRVKEVALEQYYKDLGFDPALAKQTKAVPTSDVAKKAIQALAPSKKASTTTMPNKEEQPKGSSSTSTTTNTQAEKPQGPNIPLMLFGASLLDSKKNFFSALGDGVKAYSGAKVALEDKLATQKAKEQEAQMKALEFKMQQEQNMYDRGMDQKKFGLDERRVAAYENQTALAGRTKEKENKGAITDKDKFGAINDIAKALVNQGIPLEQAIYESTIAISPENAPKQEQQKKNSLNLFFRQK